MQLLANLSHSVVPTSVLLSKYNDLACESSSLFHTVHVMSFAREADSLVAHWSQAPARHEASQLKEASSAARAHLHAMPFT